MCWIIGDGVLTALLKKKDKSSMAGQVSDIGSIISFTPESFKATYTPMACDPIEHQCFGWGVRVIGRDGWGIKTDLVAMVQDGKGGLMPLAGVTNAPGHFEIIKGSSI